MGKLKLNDIPGQENVPVNGKLGDENTNRPIKHDKRARQLLLFGSLGKGTLGFSDIDAIFEWHEKYLLIVECKVKNSPAMDLGQAKLIQALLNRWVEPKTLRDKIIKLVERFVPSELATRWLESSMILDSRGVRVVHEVPVDRDVVLADTWVDEVYDPATKKWDKVKEEIRFEDWFNDLCSSKNWDIK